MWLALIFRVFSCRISSRILPFSLCFSSFTTPRPRSFHSLLLASYLYSLHFLQHHTSHTMQLPMSWSCRPRQQQLAGGYS